jgi:SAM-dependent methyltransferase
VPQHRLPWWTSYLWDNPLRRLLHDPEQILSAFVRPGMAVLDIGSGMGYFTIAMAHMVGPAGLVRPVERDPRRLRVLEKRARKARVDGVVRSVRARVADIDLPERFGFALAFWSMHETDDPARAAERICAHLEPPARFLIAEPVYHVRLPGFQQAVAAAEAAGFRRCGSPVVSRSYAALFERPHHLHLPGQRSSQRIPGHRPAGGRTYDAGPAPEQDQVS